MTDNPETGGDPRIAELLRVNSELAGEIRDLSLGRRTQPRSRRCPRLAASPSF